MPRYLALNYLSQAVSYRRSQLESMMVAHPHHMEIVDTYVHCGQPSQTDSYLQPWNGQEVHENFVISSSIETLTKEIMALVDCYSLLTEEKLEEFNSEGEEDGSDVDLFSQDIASAMRDIDQRTAADCPVQPMWDWDLVVGEDSLGDCIMECPESPNRVDCLLTLIPSVGDLSSCLKPKLIQDPFIDENGKGYCYKDICRSDKSLELSINSDHSDSDFTRETFHPEPLGEGPGAEVDPLFTITIPNEEEPLSLVDTEVAVPVMEGQSVIGSPLLKEDSNDLQQMMEEMSERCLLRKPCEEPLELSPAAETKHKPLDFPTLNNQDTTGDSDDSGIGHALLESPLLPLPYIQDPSPMLSQQLALLKPIPMSPEGKVMFLSPRVENRLKKELLEREAVFDTILPHTLTYPDVVGLVEAVLDINVVSEVTSLLEIAPLKINGDAELELPWDPLAESYHAMELAENSLLCLQPSFLTLHTEDKPFNGRETFTRDELVCDEIAEQPLKFSQEWENKSRQHIVTKQPSYPLATAKPKTEIHPKDAAWNHLLQSTSTKSKDLTNLSRPITSKLNQQRTEFLMGISNSLPKPLGTTLNMQRPEPTVQVSNQSVEYNRQVLDGPTIPLTSSKFTTPGPMVIKQAKMDALDMDRVASDRKSVPADCGGLDAFLLLRSNQTWTGGVKRGPSDQDEGPLRKKSLEDIGNDTLMELDIIERTATATFIDVCLSGGYLSAVTKLEQFAMELSDGMVRHGIRVPGGNLRGVPMDSLKFLLKQQQKALQDNTDPSKIELYVESSQLAASLYLTCSVLNALFHCSLGVALAKLTSLCDKYHDLVGERVVPVKRELLTLQLSSQTSHPKLLELVRLVTVWRNQERRDRKERAVIVVDTEFPTLSGEILDVLQSVPGLKCCVFSLMPADQANELYLKAVEERFLLYDCLVVPVSTLTDQESFPWERVTLLTEYEQLKRPLFDQSSHGRGKCSVTVADRLNLRRYLTLRTVEDISSNDQHRYADVTDLSSIQYTLIASQRIIADTQLLQLLETRHNTLIVERDFSSFRQHHQSKCFSYCDIIIDHSTGVVLRPLTVLNSDQGVRVLVNTITALSYQLHTCWVLLYTKNENSYPYGGNIPSNLARLYASVAHYCPKMDQYRVRVITSTGTEQVAAWVRRLAESTHSNCKVLDSRKWVNRDWIEPEMTKGEKVLLSFPCLNSFSALCMLKDASLGDLFQMSSEQLQSIFPWMLPKIVKMFHSMCHSSVIPDVGEPDSAFLPSVEAATDEEQPFHLQTEDFHQEGLFKEHLDTFDQSNPPGYTSNHQTDESSNHLTYLTELSDQAFEANMQPSFNEENLHQSASILNDSLEEQPNFDSECLIIGSTTRTNQPANRDVIDLTSPPAQELTSTVVSDSYVQKSNFSFDTDNHSTSYFDQGVQSVYFKSKPTFNKVLEKTTNPSNAMRLLSSSRQMGKTPSQKQIKESVLDNMFSKPTAPTPGFNSYLGYISSSAAVKKSVKQARTPVKSLDLGFEQPKVLLQCNDRNIGACRQRQEEALGAQPQHPGLLRGVYGMEASRGLLGKDSLVPSVFTLSPPSGDTSLFDSPNLSIRLSPAKKRRLSCQRDPSRSDGQTKLVLF